MQLCIYIYTRIYMHISIPIHIPKVPTTSPLLWMYLLTFLVMRSQGGHSRTWTGGQQRGDAGWFDASAIPLSHSKYPCWLVIFKHLWVLTINNGYKTWYSFIYITDGWSCYDWDYTWLHYLVYRCLWRFIAIHNWNDLFSSIFTNH